MTLVTYGLIFTEENPHILCRNDKFP